MVVRSRLGQTGSQNPHSTQRSTSSSTGGALLRCRRWAVGSSSGHRVASTRLEPITDELYAALREHFDKKQIIETCFTVGMSNMINRLHATFHIDVDADTAELLGTACPIPLPPDPGASAQVAGPEMPQ